MNNSNQVLSLNTARKLHFYKVVNDISLETDKGNAVALVLLDLSSAFDMVDHNILISRLESCVGLQGKVLKWFQSFLTNRSFSVSIGQHSSSSRKLACGVPQGSILAPFLFSIFMLPMGAIFAGCHRARFSPQFYFLYLCYRWVLSLRGATGLDSHPSFIFYIYATDGCYL